MTWPSWLGRAARNRHRHAIEQASRRWRGGRRYDSARTRRKILIFTQVPSRLEAALAAMDTDNDGHVDIDEWCVSELYNLGCLRRGDDALR